MLVPGAGHEAVSPYNGRGEDGGGAEHGGRVRHGGGGGGGHHQGRRHGRLAEVHDLAECCRGRRLDVARHQVRGKMEVVLVHVHIVLYHTLLNKIKLLYATL